jgi:hypothetical protein
MTVRVEKLQVPVPSFLTLAVLGLISSTTALLFRLWQRPATMVMSDEWLSEHARFGSHQGLE